MLRGARRTQPSITIIHRRADMQTITLYRYTRSDGGDDSGTLTTTEITK